MVNDKGFFIPKVKKKAWDKYTEAKEMRSDKIDVESVVSSLLTIAHARVDVAACMAVIYLTASRIHEIIRWEYFSKYRQEAISLGYNIIKPGFELQQLSFYKDENGGLWWHFKTINLKQNSKKSADGIEIRARLRMVQTTNYKEIRLPAFGDLPDMRLLKFVDMYFDSVLNVYRDDLHDVIAKAKPDSFINPFKDECLKDTPFITLKYQIVYHYIITYMQMSPHNLRELRMQHLLRYYRFDIQDLHLVGGWSKKSSMALTYTKSKVSDMQKKFSDAIIANPI